MKVYRSPKFNTSDPLIWKSRILKLGKGQIYTAKAVITGFEFKANIIRIGPVTFRRYDKSIHKHLGYWNGRCVTVELKFQDKATDPPQDTPLSMFVEPFWLIHSIFQGFQLYVDSWVGLMEIQYFDKNNVNVGSFGGTIDMVSDTRSMAREPVIKRLNKKRLLKFMSSQFGDLSLAIDRFSRASSEVVDEAVLDYVIVMENLLGQGMGSISHRLSIRGALILSPTKKLREKYYRLFKYFYNLRSSMVHGAIDEIEPPSSKSESREFLTNLGANLSGAWWEDRYEISDVTRRLAWGLLRFFVENPNLRTNGYLEKLELGMEKAREGASKKLNTSEK